MTPKFQKRLLTSVDAPLGFGKFSNLTLTQLAKYEPEYFGWLYYIAKPFIIMNRNVIGDYEELGELAIEPDIDTNYDSHHRRCGSRGYQQRYDMGYDYDDMEEWGGYGMYSGLDVY
jgi:hypothetical protein